MPGTGRSVGRTKLIVARCDDERQTIRRRGAMSIVPPALIAEPEAEPEPEGERVNRLGEEGFFDCMRPRSLPRTERDGSGPIPLRMTTNACGAARAQKDHDEQDFRRAYYGSPSLGWTSASGPGTLRQFRIAKKDAGGSRWLGVNSFVHLRRFHFLRFRARRKQRKTARRSFTS